MGTLGLTTPWARRAITAEDRARVEAAIPDHITVGVSVEPNHAKWVLWTVEDRQAGSKLRVSTSLPLVEACWFALRHWGIGSQTVTTDAEGYVTDIEDEWTNREGMPEFNGSFR
jgi:hypothetical protein